MNVLTTALIRKLSCQITAEHAMSMIAVLSRMVYILVNANREAQSAATNKVLCNVLCYHIRRHSGQLYTLQMLQKPHIG